MGLSAREVQAAKPEKKDRLLTDGDGLFLNVRASGTKQWQFRYRLGGKQKKAILGHYPEISLKAARDMRDRMRSDLARGDDPGNTDLSEYKPETFAKMATEWHAKQLNRWSPGHAQRVWSRIENDLLPAFGDRAVSSVKRKDVLDALRAVEARGAIDMAKRVGQYAVQIFDYALSEEHIEFNPAVNLSKSLSANPPTKHHPRLTDAQLPGFFAKLARYEGDHTRLGLKLVLHTFVRTGELLGATEAELDFDAMLWRIPGARMKRGLDHIVPLTPTSKALFEELVEMNPSGGRLLPISSNTMIFAMYRMGYHTKATVHGFRSTASTVLNESGLWRPDAIERQLAHVPDDQVRAAYNAAQYLPERREMMAWWADFLLEKEAEGTPAPRPAPVEDDDFEDLLADVGLA